jgi:hypothetical protein
MADNHGVATASGGMDMPAHETSYSQFIALTQLVAITVLCIVLQLVLWGLEGHGFVALFGFLITAAAAALGGFTGMGWKLVLPVFVLLGLACIVL